MTTFDDHARPCRRLKSLRWWLREDNGALSRLLRHAHTNARQQQKLQILLPQELAGHWRLARLDTQVLCLVAETPLWATHLRYRRTVLLQGAAVIVGQPPRQFQIRVEPASMIRPSQPPARLLSMKAAESLRQSAAGMGEGPLREALLRLASRSGDK
ncbi:MAG TPA: DUF721 domain-containing protein [Nitrococcus sp.]|nr:DUF721 domain-containing protein [Nitrococcus sp.]